MDELFGVQEGGVSCFSLTTPELIKLKLQCVEAVAPNEISKYKFVSAGISTKHLVRSKGVLVEYQTLSQKAQYTYIYNKLNNHEFFSFSRAFIIFEQTKLGNIHFHAVLYALENDHDIRAEFYDCFGIKKGKSVRHFIDIKEINDMKGMIDYLFNKKEKDYEAVDQRLFKPLKGIKLPKGFPKSGEVVPTVQGTIQDKLALLKQSFTIEL